MSQDLLEAASKPEPAAIPDGVPEKFWDAEAGTLRTEALLKSYLELERRLSQRAGPPAPDAPEEERQRFLRALGVPEKPDGYAITAPHDLLSADAAINARLHEAGFTPKQAQLVYDLAAERLLPLIADAVREVEAEREVDRLRAHFGGDEAFRRMAGQIAAWGRANLAPHVFEALSTSHDGVVAMHGMMAKREPALMRAAEQPAASQEQELRVMMRDPRYWRTREPDFVKRVTEGFRRLTKS
ncbi:capsid assembly protein [Plastoroseomonas arctica]|uniref:Uncharacterized protein n=1 Tax=Plastoroseomonas arctica TaxID=1509237 RepID=A0AAF1KJB7_9PROT|nr:hypothetical protein [Plastoroseomonas arctica]MBR0654795.1 hypothetical protein [Plastoroseomonas arctica]